MWLADEDPDEETAKWCHKKGVKVSTRRGVAAYHRSSWPRRSKCKEGNLAYFYDMHGYQLYDAVAQLDADHIPTATYLSRMISPFNDPAVGYVAAPSICDLNAKRSWAARGRLYAEAVLHGPTQAGHNGGMAPSCIGSHYAVRTKALKEIGGLGPELAEDFTTTLMMNSFGWQGIFAFNAEAHGDGPETFADCMTQEFQWSRSMTNVLLTIYKRYRKTLPWSVRLHLTFCQWWYPMFGLLMLASVLLPLFALLTRIPLVQVGLGSFYLHFLPSILILLLTVFWLKKKDHLRPTTAHPLSWELAIFQLVRWPWALIGVSHALVGRILGREFSFKVTPKGREGIVIIPLKVIMPYIILAIASIAPAAINWNPGRARGYFLLALINAILYSGSALLIVFFHIWEHGSKLRLRSLGRSAMKVGLACLAVGATAATVEARGFLDLPPLPPRGRALIATVVPPKATPSASLKETSFQLGATTLPLAVNSTTRWTNRDLSSVVNFENEVGYHAKIVMWYSDWAHVSSPSLKQLNLVSTMGAIPEITWEPWNYLKGIDQPKYSLKTIIEGKHDAYVRRWAKVLAAYGLPVYLRFAQELNGTWYPWGGTVNGNTPAEFAQAWRHIWTIFQQEGATNVKWIWSVVNGNRTQHLAQEWPGDQYVNMVGFTVLNGGVGLHWGGWRSFSNIINKTVLAVRALAPSEPEQMSETGTPLHGGKRVQWLNGMFAYLRTNPLVTSLIWFDLPKQANWTLGNSPSIRNSFSTGFSSLGLSPAA